MPTEVESFAELEAEFTERVSSVIWCNMATIDTVGRPRSRIVHPVWQGSTGWVASRPTSFKVKHLAATPYVSLAYVTDTAKPVYVDCSVEWVKSIEEKARVWDFMKSLPAPYGFDPTTLFPNGADDPACGFLKLTPWRLEVANFMTGSMLVWRPKEE